MELRSSSLDKKNRKGLMEKYNCMICSENKSKFSLRKLCKDCKYKYCRKCSSKMSNKCPICYRNSYQTDNEIDDDSQNNNLQHNNENNNFNINIQFYYSFPHTRFLILIYNILGIYLFSLFIYFLYNGIVIFY